jgi:hypothetical protein
LLALVVCCAKSFIGKIEITTARYKKHNDFIYPGIFNLKVEHINAG